MNVVVSVEPGRDYHTCIAKPGGRLQSAKRKLPKGWDWVRLKDPNPGLLQLGAATEHGCVCMIDRAKWAVQDNDEQALAQHRQTDNRRPSRARRFVPQRVAA